MDRAHEPRWSTMLLALAVAAIPLAVGVAVRAMPAVEVGVNAPWVRPTFAVALAVAGGAAGVAWLVPALRAGSVASLLMAGAWAALAGGAVGLLAGAESLAIPLLAASGWALGASVVGGRRLRDWPAARVGAAVLVMAAAEAVAVATIVPAIGGALAPAAPVLLGLAAAGWLTITVLARGPAAIAAAVTAAGCICLALDRGLTLESVVGLAAIAGGAMLAAGATDPVPADDGLTQDVLPDLAARLRDAVLRFDGHLRLREWNASAGQLLALDAGSAGARIDDLLGVALSELPGDGAVSVSHHGVGALEIAMHRSGAGVVAVIRDPGVATEADQLGSELRATIEELLRARRTIDLQRGELERSATVDPLTGVASRGAILERLRLEVAQARRYRHPLAVVQLDVDGFGEINARHGIAGGDTVLREVALRMRLRVREADALGRCGSDGFLAALPHTDEGGAATFADALRHRLAQRAIVLGDDEIRASVSIGVATMQPGEDLDLDGLLARVQEALDSARSAGGDRIALDRLHGLARLEPREGGPSAAAEPEAG